MGFKTTIKNNIRFMKMLERLDKSFVKVGVIGDPARDAKLVQNGGVESSLMGTTVAQVAAAHEFGVPEKNIPERSFIRRTTTERGAEIAKTQMYLLDQVLKEKMTLERALGLLGLKVQAEIRDVIRKGIPPPNDANTIRRKGSSVPLIDTGQMLNSINYTAHPAGEE